MVRVFARATRTRDGLLRYLWWCHNFSYLWTMAKYSEKKISTVPRPIHSPNLGHGILEDRNALGLASTGYVTYGTRVSGSLHQTFHICSRRKADKDCGGRLAAGSQQGRLNSSHNRLNVNPTDQILGARLRRLTLGGMICREKEEAIPSGFDSLPRLWVSLSSTIALLYVLCTKVGMVGCNGQLIAVYYYYSLTLFSGLSSHFAEDILSIFGLRCMNR